MAKIDIGNVVRVTLLSALRGLANVNTSALALITDEQPIPADFGTFRSYLSPEAVADDFGSASDTYRLAVRVFAQNPNILTGGGYLVVIPRDDSAAAQAATVLSDGSVDFTALSAEDYNINVSVGGAAAADLLIGSIDATDLDSAVDSLNSTAVAAANLVFEASGEVTAATVRLKTTATGVAASIEIAAATTGTDIAPLIGMAGAEATGADAGLERVKDAVLRTNGAVPYFGIIVNEVIADAVLTELANTVQTMDKLLFAGSNVVGTTDPTTGVFALIKDAGLTHTRCLLYSGGAVLAVDFAAGYASRGLSTNFDGNNTAQTMHMKEIVGLVADAGMTQTRLDAAKSAGVDVYADFGVPKLFTSGANQYFDQVYNRMALKVRLQIAGFNFLAQTNTKIPQTETGLAALKGAYRQVMQLFVSNGVLAPGQWNSPTTFGTPEDHIRNIRERGYYIYAIPIAQQAQAQREARIAPLVQIGAKESGAFHSSDVTVLVEA